MHAKALCRRRCAIARFTACSALVLIAGCAGCGDGRASADAGIVPVSDYRDGGRCTGSLPVFLERHGGTYRSGSSDSRTNTSEFLRQDEVVQTEGAIFDDSAWDTLSACVADGLAAYDVVVTDIDPGIAPHMEVVLTTRGDHMGLSSRSLAVGPFTCEPSKNGLAFVFSETLGLSAVLSCMATLSVMGHMVGLEHVMDCGDVMSETPNCDLADPARRFLDASSECGIYAAASCECGGRTSQNSHQRMLERLGPCPE